MVQVQTVRGAVAADALGTVLIHEHVFVRSPDVLTNYPALWNEEERVADAVARLRALKERGVDTIADPTVLGLGRDIRRVARVNDQVDLNIVTATGLYTYDGVRCSSTSAGRERFSAVMNRWSTCSSRTSRPASPAHRSRRRSSSARSRTR
jgi:predicted metal-dependent phosphotriesterase family hydrolase